MAPKTLSLADLDTQKKCEDAVEMEVVSPSGKGLGIFLSVIGGQSPTVQNWVNKALNQRRRADFINERKGKKGEVRAIEDDIEFGTEVIAIRIKGWRGISDEYTPENALRLCTINSDICTQVREFTEDISNFTKG